MGTAGGTNMGAITPLAAQIKQQLHDKVVAHQHQQHQPRGTGSGGGAGGESAGTVGGATTQVVGFGQRLSPRAAEIQDLLRQNLNEHNTCRCRKVFR